MLGKIALTDAPAAGAIMRPDAAEALTAPYMHYRVECCGPDGAVKWVEEFDNLVTTAGKTDIIDKYVKASAYTASWFLGLKGTGTAAVGDTLASHAGWSEVTPYSGNRPGITWGTTASGSNTATAVTFTMNATATVAGAFVCNAASGTSGTLYSVGDFAASRSVGSGDTINLTMTFSAT